MAFAAADGTYTISGLDAGTYSVSFSHQDNPSPVVSAPYAGGAVSLPTADAAVTGIDQTLQAAAIVSGTISTPAGSGPYTGGVEILGGPTFQSHAAGTYLSAVNQGSFALGGLAPGTYKVRYSGTGEWATMWRGGVATAAESTTITLVAGQDNAPINDVAVAAASISGSLTGGAGQYQFVEALASDGSTAAATMVNTGTYSLGNLFPGSYKIQFNRASGIATTAEAQYYNNLPEGSGAQGATVVNAAAGANPGIDAALQAGGTLTGKIAGAQGQPLENVPVRVYTKDGSLVTRGTNTAADGTFTVTGLTTGNYLVAANMITTRSTGSLGQIFSGNVLSESSASPVATAAGQNTDIGTLSFATAGNSGTPVFTDVPAGSPYAAEIAWLAEKGISTGWTEADGSKTYRPFEPIHRNAMAAFMYRFNSKPEFIEPSVSPFADVPVGGPFYKEITWLAGQGITTGWSEADGTKTFRPFEPIHRNAMAAFMYRLAGQPEFTPPAVSPFADVPVGGPFYKEITWLASQQITTGWSEADGTKTFRPFEPIHRNAMAAFMYRFNVKFPTI